MVAEKLQTIDDTVDKGEIHSPERHTVERAYRNGNRWRENPLVNVSNKNIIIVLLFLPFLSKSKRIRANYLAFFLISLFCVSLSCIYLFTIF